MPQLKQGSEVVFFKGVPLTKSYEIIARCKSASERDNISTGIFSNLSRVSMTVGTSNPISYQSPMSASVRVAWSVTNTNDPMTYNYMRFRNPYSYNENSHQFDERDWIYCFIDEVKYINNNVWEFFYTIDVFMTYQFDIDWGNSSQYIERMHVADDRLGKHLIDEGLDCGEYVMNASLGVDSQYGPFFRNTGSALYPVWNKSDMAVVTIETSYGSEGSASRAISSGCTTNCYSALRMRVYDCEDELGALKAHIESLADDGHSNALIGMYMFPAVLIPTPSSGTREIPKSNYYTNVPTTQKGFARTYTRPTNIDGYSPKNNKLLTMPYSRMLVISSDGGRMTYGYEYFSSNGPELWCCGTVSSRPSISLYPCGYKMRNIPSPNADDNNQVERINFNEGITVDDVCVCGWQSDVYKNWLAQNQFKREATTLSAGVGLLAGVGLGVAGLATGGVGAIAGAGVIASTLTSTFSTAENLMAERKKAEIAPGEAMGKPVAPMSLAVGHFGFTVYVQEIKAQNAKKIDDYFTRFGYKINEIMLLPCRYSGDNFVNRPYYTYIKTVGCNLDVTTGIPQPYLDLLNKIFDKGTTVWNAHRIHFGDTSWGNYLAVSNNANQS